MKKLLVARCWLLAAVATSATLPCGAAVYGTLNAQTNLVHAPKVVNVGGYWRGTSRLTEAQANALGYKLVVDERPVCASNEYAVAVGWVEREVEDRVEKVGGGEDGMKVIGEGEGEQRNCSSSSVQPTTCNLQPEFQHTTCNLQPVTRIYRVYEKRTIEPQPRKFSKLKIYAAISTLGETRYVASETADTEVGPPVDSAATWAKVQAWLEGKTVNGMNGWLAFQLAQEISEDHPLFAAWAEEARQLLGITTEQFETLLNACILEP